MYALIFKTNPYRDSAGRYTSKDKGTNGVAGELTSLQWDGVHVSVSASDWAVHGGKLSPKDIIKVSSGNPFGDGERGISIGDNGGVTYVQNGGSIFGASIENVQRTFYPKLGVVEHNYLKLSDAEQGSGVVKKMFREAIPAYERMGMNRIDLLANLDGGAYAWGKYGFTAKDPAQFRDAYQKGMGRLHSDMVSNRLELSPESRTELRKVREILEANKGSKYITHALTDVKTPHLDWDLREIYPKGKGMTYTKAVLRDAQWDGELDLKDERARKRLHDYINP